MDYFHIPPPLAPFSLSSRLPADHGAPRGSVALPAAPCPGRALYGWLLDCPAGGLWIGGPHTARSFPPVSLQGKSLSRNPADFLQDIPPRLVLGFGDVTDGGLPDGIASAQEIDSGSRSTPMARLAGACLTHSHAKYAVPQKSSRRECGFRPNRVVKTSSMNSMSASGSCTAR